MANYESVQLGQPTIHRIGGAEFAIPEVLSPVGVKPNYVTDQAFLASMPEGGIIRKPVVRGPQINSTRFGNFIDGLAEYVPARAALVLGIAAGAAVFGAAAAEAAPLKEATPMKEATPSFLADQCGGIANKAETLVRHWREKGILDNVGDYYNIPEVDESVLDYIKTHFGLATLAGDVPVNNTGCKDGEIVPVGTKILKNGEKEWVKIGALQAEFPDGFSLTPRKGYKRIKRFVEEGISNESSNPRKGKPGILVPVYVYVPFGSKQVKETVVAGKPGRPGSQGPQGRPGSQGPQGRPGSQGPAGRPGATGKTGAKGETGATGKTGATGPAGKSPTPQPSATANIYKIAEDAAREQLKRVPTRVFDWLVKCINNGVPVKVGKVVMVTNPARFSCPDGSTFIIKENKKKGWEIDEDQAPTQIFRNMHGSFDVTYKNHEVREPSKPAETTPTSARPKEAICDAGSFKEGIRVINEKGVSVSFRNTVEGTDISAGEYVNWGDGKISKAVFDADGKLTAQHIYDQFGVKLFTVFVDRNGNFRMDDGEAQAQCVAERPFAPAPVVAVPEPKKSEASPTPVIPTPVVVVPVVDRCLGVAGDQAVGDPLPTGWTWSGNVCIASKSANPAPGGAPPGGGVSGPLPPPSM